MRIILVGNFENMLNNIGTSLGVICQSLTMICCQGFIKHELNVSSCGLANMQFCMHSVTIKFV